MHPVKFKCRIILSLIPDLIVILILFIPSIISPWITPFQRVIDIDDRSISFPRRSETFPSWSLPLITFFLPAAIIFAVYLGQGRKRPALLLGILGLLFSVALTATITDIIKNMTGRLRPDFLARCQPEKLENGQVICKQIHKAIVNEGRRSFPSGHASSAFASLGFVSLFLIGQLRVFNGSGYVWKMGLSLSPVIFAFIVAFSRIIDYRHHVTDVLVGIILGSIVAWSIYRMYFPPVTSFASDVVFTKRVDDIRSSLPVEENNGGCEAV